MKIYANNKPYITKEVIECIKEKKRAYRLGGAAGLKLAQKDLNHLEADTTKECNELLCKLQCDFNSRVL